MSDQKLTHIESLANKNYIGTHHLAEGEGVFRRLVVKVEKVEKLDVRDSEGNLQSKVGVHLEGQLSFLLNKVNRSSLTDYFETPFVEHWRGKMFTLCVKSIKAFGVFQPALRAEKFAGEELTPSNVKLWEGASRKLRENKTDMDKLCATVYISPINKSKLLNEVSKPSPKITKNEVKEQVQNQVPQRVRDNDESPIKKG